MNLKDLSDLKHILRQTQIKMLNISQYLGDVVDMIESKIEKHGKHKVKKDKNDKG